MDGTIALLLVQDGLVTGAVYALLALALVLVFTVTRVIFVPQGEFVAFGALSLASLQLGVVPGLVWLLGAGGAAAVGVEIVSALRSGKARRIPGAIALYGLVPAAAIALTSWLAPRTPSLAVQVLLVLALVVPLGPIAYRLFFQPLAQASVLVLLIVAVALHFALQGFSLVFFGPEGYRVQPFATGQIQFGPLFVTAQMLWVLGTSAVLMLLLYLFFDRTLLGKALRATAVNRVGARLVGIGVAMSGRIAFTLAAAIGAISGMLIVTLTTLYYDSGFLIGLKGFVGSVAGGIASFPLAVAGALVVGILEAFAAFWHSAFKEVIVFAALIPLLVWLSLRAPHAQTDEEEQE